jgi:beta-glucanase (GH16 family)
LLKQDNIHGTIHCIDSGAGSALKINGSSQSYHIYKVDWSPTQISFSADGTTYFTYSKPSNATLNNWPFDNSFNVIFNTAVGGTWGGSHGVNNSIFPQTFSIDYIKYTPYAAGSNNNSSNNSIIVIPNVKWTYDANTNSKWAMSCDWTGMDWANAQVSGAQCATKCQTTSGCTHFTWSGWQGGTCWMKTGALIAYKSTIVANSTAGNVCGYRINS